MRTSTQYGNACFVAANLNPEKKSKNFAQNHVDVRIVPKHKEKSL